jgi:periplasmic divalent cation tolerance protein
MDMADYIQVATTADKRELAEQIASHLVEGRLAACVQVLGPMTSTYRWQGKIERAEEWLCLAKTRRDLFPQVEAAIRKVHTYEVPEILALPIIAGSPAYLEWMEKELPNESQEVARESRE